MRVRRLLVVMCALVALAAGLAGSVTSARGADDPFGLGVAAGDVTATSVILWTRAPRPGRVAVELLARQGARLPTAQTTARRIDDLTVRIPVRGLRAATLYRYRFRQGAAASQWGSFRTAPLPGVSARVRFAISGDADATPGPSGAPAFNRFETYARMAQEGNDFNVNLGDTIYSDSEVGGTPPAVTISAKWEKYRLGLALPALRRLRASTGLYSHWDDHEFVNDFSRAENGGALYRAGVKAFTDYAPVAFSPTTGLFRTFRWGRHVELFFLDERSFRSAKVDDVCDRDLAPTAPAAIRAGFGAIAPSLAKPVAEACLAALADPARTMLGTAQEAAFLKALRSSTATWKVIVNEVPLLQLYALPYDRWEGYAASRGRIIAALQGVPNVVVLTTDTHAHLIGEIRTSTLEGPEPVGTGVWEVVTGPVATNTYAKEIDGFLGAPGAGSLVNALFFKPPPPRGLGLACAATDQFGYAEVVVTAATLTVTPKTPAGTLVPEPTGQRCAPLVLRAR